MSSLLFAVLFFAFFALQAICQDIGGSNSVASLVQQLINDFNKANGASIPAYKNVNSGVGTQNFLSKTYELGVSISPLSAAQESTARKSGNPAGHVPFTISAISVVTKNGGLKLTGKQLGQIYLGQITKWEQIPGSGKSGTIVPLIREDGAAATEVVFKYIKKSYPAWPSKFVGTDSFNTGNPNLKAVRGSDGVASTAAANEDAIGYVLTNIAVVKYGIKEVALQNKAGKFVTAATSDLYQSIPRKIPATFSSWSGVDLIYKAGAKTFPVVSFAYFLIRQNYKGVSSGKRVVAFLKYTQSFKGQLISSAFYYSPIPSKVVASNNAGIKKIKT